MTFSTAVAQQESTSYRSSAIPNTVEVAIDIEETSIPEPTVIDPGDVVPVLTMPSDLPATPLATEE